MTSVEPATRWLDAIEMRAWRSFIECIGDLWNALDADLVAEGLSMGDYQVLVYLAESEDGSLRMRDLATMLQLSPSGLTRRLDGLVQSGYVERRGAADDRRVMLAVLTHGGRDKLVECAPRHVGSVRKHLIDWLDHDQLIAMGDIFATVGAHFRDASGDAGTS